MAVRNRVCYRLIDELIVQRKQCNWTKDPSDLGKVNSRGRGWLLSPPANVRYQIGENGRMSELVRGV